MQFLHNWLKKTVRRIGVLRISQDAKNKVAIGDFFQRRQKLDESKTGDHDFVKEHLTPYVLNLPASKQNTLYFVESKVERV